MALTADRQDFTAFLRPVEGGGRSLELLVKGARCAACMAKIEGEVRALPAVETARLNLTTGKLTVASALRSAVPGALCDTVTTACPLASVTTSMAAPVVLPHVRVPSDVLTCTV